MIETSKMEAVGAIERIEAKLQERIGTERFDLWFDRKTELHLAGDTLTVKTGNPFAANWIRGKFADDLRAAALAAAGREVRVAVIVQEGIGRNDETPAEAADKPTPQPAARPAPIGMAPPPLVNPRHTLEEYVVGACNQLAYHAAVKVAENPGQQFNPLFVHGNCGMGKTHLLQGICQRFAKLHPGKKWLYLTGEQFTNDFLEAIKTHKTQAFRKRIRAADLLVIDDVHFLANKKATQEEFLHTFNQIDAGGRQIVLASDSAPREIGAMAESLTSRFVSGMVMRIDAPDLATRMEILRRKVARNGWQVSDAVLMHVANSHAASVRELEGMLLQVVAGMSLVNAGADAASVAANLRERGPVGRGPVAVERIVAATAEYFGVASAALLGSSREKVVSLARAAAMHLGRQHTGMSYPELGRAMGRKNHSTVIAACQRVEALLETGELVCWQMGQEARHQSMSDVVSALEAALRRGK